MPIKAKKKKVPVMKKFRVFASWEMSGFAIVEAFSKQEAEDKMDSTEVPMPDNGEYVSDSYRIDRDFTLEFDNKKSEWVECQN